MRAASDDAVAIHLNLTGFADHAYSVTVIITPVLIRPGNMWHCYCATKAGLLC